MDGRRQANIHQLMLMSADLAAQHHLSTETKTPGAFDFSSGLSPLSHSEKISPAGSPASVSSFLPLLYCLQN